MEVGRRRERTELKGEGGREEGRRERGGGMGGRKRGDG